MKSFGLSTFTEEIRAEIEEADLSIAPLSLSTVRITSLPGKGIDALYASWLFFTLSGKSKTTGCKVELFMAAVVDTEDEWNTEVGETHYMYSKDFNVNDMEELNDEAELLSLDWKETDSVEVAHLLAKQL